MKPSKIAILGAGSHIAKGLILNFLQTENTVLYLYTRSAQKVLSFINSIEEPVLAEYFIQEGYTDGIVPECDLLINCVGVGTVDKLEGELSRWFMVIEEFDNLCLAYLQKNPETLYISLSSGAVYGKSFISPAEENTANTIQVNHITSQDYYSIARINSEAKHRSFSDYKIVDLRVFSYFSRFADLTDRYFIIDVINCILNGKVLSTNDINIIRDYVHPKDLFNLIKRCLQAGNINTAFDTVSKAPVTKNEILDYFASEYGLIYEVKKALEISSGTGMKNIYYSKYNKAAEIGYEPEFTSLEAIMQESKYILKPGF